MKSNNSLSTSLDPYTELIIKELHFKSYHFIELFIYFNNFIENEVISEDSFITAQTTLLNSEEESDEEEIEALSQKIYAVLSSSSSSSSSSTEANIVSLCCYLKKISIATSSEFDVDVLFALLDKENKGYIDYSDIETLISSFEDFINETSVWDTYENSFSGKKIIKRNLTQNHFYEELKKLFVKANVLIEQRLNEVIEEQKRIESNKKPMPIIEGVNVSMKNKDKDNNNNTNQATNSNYNACRSSVEDIKVIHTDDTIHCDLVESFLDQRKIEIVKKIKRTSYLYNVQFEDFLKAISPYECELFTKSKFIKVLNQIITSHTSDLLESPMRKLALSMLYQTIDLTHNNRISFFELIGGVLPLTKLSTEYNLLETIFKYPIEERILILSGLLSLYIKSEVVKDLHIFSEIIFASLSEKNIKTISELFQWIYKGTPKESQFMSDTYVVHTDILISPSNQDITLILNTIEGRIQDIKAQFSPEITSLSVLEMTLKLIKHSSLGVINAYQLSNLVNEIIWATHYSDAKKMKLVNETLTFIEQHIDFSQNEVIDAIHLHALDMLVFSGTTIEKLQSIFIIHDIGDNDPIDYYDLCAYVRLLFDFLLKETKIGWCDSNTLTNVIGEYIVKEVGPKITLTCLINVYEKLVNVFGKTKDIKHN